MSKLLCPKCKKHLTIVYSTKSNDNEVIRYRKCSNSKCGYRFKTIEKTMSGWSSDLAIKKIRKIVEKF